MSDPRDLVVVGGGEHARVVIEAARSRPDLWNVTGFVDPEPCTETAERLGLARLGDDDFAHTPREAWFIVAVGSIGVSPLRQQIVGRYSAHRVRWASVVHSQAWVSPSALLGQGVAVMAGACINSGARIGDHAVINTGSVVEHDVVLGDFAQVAPGCVIGGGTEVGSSSYLGLGARLRDHIRIGQGVTVGMGAVVLRSVPDGELLMGFPARPAPSEGGSHA